MNTLLKTGFFSPRRFGQLLLRDASNGYRGWLIAATAVAGTVVVLSALTILGTSRIPGVRADGISGYYGSFYVQLLFLGGLISTSFAFREIRQNGAGIFYLTLPASPLEKFASKLLTTTVGYALGSLLFFTATAAVSEALNRLIFGVGHGMFNPFSPAILRAAGVYMLAQSAFLLGSIWFKKLAFMRTVLWLCIVAIGLAVVTAVAVRIILADRVGLNMVQAGAGRVGGMSLNLSREVLEGRFGPGGPGHSGLLVFKVLAQILGGALPLAFWVAAYFRLRETEV